VFSFVVFNRIENDHYTAREENDMDMVEMLLIGGVASALLVLITATLLWRSQRRRLHEVQIQQQAWQRTQEIQQQQWQIKQEKLGRDLEKKLAEQTQHIYNEWKAWESRDAQRVEELQRQYYTAEQRSRIEHELARLPYVEDMPTIQNERHPWRPPQLRGVDLSHRDLSHRYLHRADLRNANLAHANLFMADLSNASLAGANLTGADLAGANLTGADLRNATLVEANLLVTDLNDAILTGANLLGVRSLTIAQLYTTTYDATTQLNLEIDITQPRTPSLRRNSDLLLTPRPQELATDAQLHAISLPAPTREENLEENMVPIEATSVEQSGMAEEEQQPEPPASSPSPSDDGAVIAEETGPQEDTPGNKRTEKTKAVTPRRKRNGKKPASVNAN
jgi:gas vesicle protein